MQAELKCEHHEQVGGNGRIHWRQVWKPKPRNLRGWSSRPHLATTPLVGEPLAAGAPTRRRPRCATWRPITMTSRSRTGPDSCVPSRPPTRSGIASRILDSCPTEKVKAKTKGAHPDPSRGETSWCTAGGVARRRRTRLRQLRARHVPDPLSIVPVHMSGGEPLSKVHGDTGDRR